MPNGGIAEKTARWSVLLLCALLPFFFVPAPWTSIPQAKMLLVIALVVLATIAWIGAALSAGSLRVPKSALFFAIPLLPIAYLISALATGGSHLSFIGGTAMQDTVVTVLIWYALFVACTTVLGTGLRPLVAAVRMFLLSGTVVLLIQVFHLAFPSFTFGGALVGQAASVIGNWHDLGIFLGLLLFLSIALIPSPVATSRVWRLLLIAIATASAALLVIVNFRDVLIATAAITLVYALYLWVSSRGTDEVVKRIFTRRIGISLIVVAMLAGLYFAGTIIHSVLPAPLQVTRLEVRPSWQGTFAVGSQVFSQPSTIFFGTGPNTFPREWGLHKPLSVNVTQFWNIDFYSGVGFIPTAFVTVGLLGALAWAAVCLTLLISGWRVFRSRAEASPLNLLRFALVGAAAYLTAFHVLYVPGPALSALTFVLLGAVVAVELIAGVVKGRVFTLDFGSWRGQILSIVLIVFAFLVLFGGLQSTRALLSDMLITKAVVAYNTDGDLANASRTVGNALRVWPGNDRGHRAAVELGILQFAQLAASGNTDEAALTQLQNTLTATVQHGLAAVTLGGANYQNWLSLARLYGELAGAGVEGAEEKARTAYEEASKNNPTNPLPLLELAQMDLIQGDDASARERLTAALAIKPDLAVALFLFSQIDARAGDFAAAREKAGAVVQLVPDDPLGWYNLGTILYAEENYENSALAFERAVGLQNDYSNALFLMSASYAYLGRYQDALTALNATLTLNPEAATLPPMISALEKGENPFETAPAVEE